MRRPLIAGNWKMHKNLRESIELVTALKRELHSACDRDLAVCPPFTALATVGEILQGSGILLGAQDISYEPEGAFTGEVSGVMLRDVGCRLVIIGHSERRRLFGDTNEVVRKKIGAALLVGLTPIVCVGETLDKREQGVTDEFLRKQCDGSFERLGEREFRQCVIAYEPVWAIGTGRTATPAQASAAHSTIRLWARERYSATTADALRILYGGSVTPDNVEALMAMEGIDGALVGGASLKAEPFSRIARFRVH
jgi:triosephosphate isomerase